MLELIGCLDEIGRNREIRAVILARPERSSVPATTSLK